VWWCVRYPARPPVLGTVGPNQLSGK